MIIGKYFEGDNDEELKMYQHSCYYDSLHRWINLAGKRRLHYRGLPEWQVINHRWEKFREEGCFDHRCIQAHHDLIAQRYRMPRKTPFQLVGKNGWPAYFDSEAAMLMKNEEILRLFMAAVACENTKDGYDAEDALLDKMQEKYGMGNI